VAVLQSSEVVVNYGCHQKDKVLNPRLLKPATSEKSWYSDPNKTTAGMVVFFCFASSRITCAEKRDLKKIL